MEPSNALRAWLGNLYLWACELLYRRFASVYEVVAWAVSLGRWHAWRQAAARLLVGERILELGPGPGVLLHEIAAGVPFAAGLEPSSRMLAAASRRAEQGAGQGDSCALLVGGMAQVTPFASGSFDAVLATFPAPYIAETTTLGEIARVLRPGGRLVVGGLWVIPASPLLRALPLLYGTQATSLHTHLVASLELLGLRAEFVEMNLEGDRVGVLVAHKEPKDAG